MSAEPLDLDAIKHGDTREKVKAIATEHFVRACSSDPAVANRESERGFVLAKVSAELAVLIAEVERLRGENARQTALLADIGTHADWLMTRGFACDGGVYSCFAAEHSIGEKVAKIRNLADQRKGE